MTNKQIIERLEKAGHPVTGSPNRATLEALAAEKGVSLEEVPAVEESSGAPTEIVEDGPDDFERNRLVTPSMAVVRMCGHGSAPEVSDAGEPDKQSPTAE